MIVRLMTVFFATALAAAAALAQPAQPELKLGDDAPPLGGKVTWLKGDPVNTYEKGHVYVLDFWATWCGPCIAAMPHLNEVANEYRDRGVTVIGIAIWPRDNMQPTAEFVRQRSDEMQYVVAEDIDDRVGQAYMAAAQQTGIPTSMIIDGEGRLVWIGHPMEDFEKVLDNVLSPDFDIEVVLARQRALERGTALIHEAEELAKADDWDASFKKVDEAVALDPEQFGWIAAVKFQYLLGRFNRIDEAYEYGRMIVRDVIKNDPVLLENLAKFILEGPGFEARDYELAKAAIDRANEITEGEEPAVLDTLAKVCFAMGDVKDAYDIQKKAMAMVDDPRVRADMQRQLEEYENAMRGASD